MSTAKGKSKAFFKLIITIVAGVAINVALLFASRLLNISLYLDSIGTILTAMFGGTLPSVFVGFITNAIGAAMMPMKIYFGLINVLVAVMVAVLSKRRVFDRLWATAAAAVSIAVFCAVLSTVITWFVYGRDFGNVIPSDMARSLYESGKANGFFSLLISNLFYEGIDKIISVSVAALLYRFAPEKFKKGLTSNLFIRDYKNKFIGKKGVSITTKFAAIIVAAEILLGAVTAGVSYYIYREISVRTYTERCNGVSKIAASYIDGDKVEEYLATNGNTEEYKKTKDLLYNLRESFEQIEYVYVYRIENDGCHVVFDLDTEEIAGSEINTVIEFDESFSPYLDDLFAGKPIDPIVTDDTYGWLLTVYTPVYDSNNNCVCYAAADIMMDSIITDEIIFIAKVLCLFFSTSVLILTVIIHLIEQGVISPINGMAHAAGNLVFDDGEGQENSLKNLKELNITSQDEIGDLYHSLDKMAVDTAEYIKEVKYQAKVIEKLQESIIVDFAELVEARDKCTGDHIKKTSYYVGKIAEELRREGKFTDILTDEYIAHLKRSAPLHDIGKIKVSDTILNKPGKLTDEEFSIMKTHTTEGESILKNSSAFAQNEEYLEEAANMAAYHHERWDGYGYPYTVSGEDIPLSARIMAVADVFDALLSRRSYKEPFNFEKAVEIIKEESGTHFDPDVVEAFLNIAENLKNEQ